MRGVSLWSMMGSSQPTDSEWRHELVVIDVALFLLTQVINRQLGVRGPGITDPVHLADAPE